jgi:hypothetical protein
VTGGSSRSPAAPPRGRCYAGRFSTTARDWQVVTPDGTAIIDTRYLLRLDDGALVYLQTRGFRYGPPDLLAAVAEGVPVDPHDYFFRVYMTFETASATYGWLNRAMAIGSAMRLQSGVIYDAYLVT